ncbi:MAG: 50S ribosomal protein L21 [Actinobacteria bacterium]|nr:MAG: 50S ribosomal protein L21 [Actinomycetota bacterium]
MFAIVRAGGHQEKVAVGDVIAVDRIDGEPGSTINLPVLLLVDGENVTHAASALAETPVTAEIVEHTRGPKITILRYKNKTGYRRRQGHRQDLTKVRVTAIGSGN